MTEQEFVKENTMMAESKYKHTVIQLNSVFTVTTALIMIIMNTHRYHHGNGSSEAPDESVIH